MCQLLIINDSNLYGASEDLEIAKICIFAVSVKISREDQLWRSPCATIKLCRIFILFPFRNSRLYRKGGF